MRREWIQKELIKTSHSNIPIRQIYLWVVTQDNKVAIVGRNNKYQFPGGKPNPGESKDDTIRRELNEETSLVLEDLDSDPIFFGYYLITNDETFGDFLQLRYVLNTPKNSSELTLKTNENEDDIDTMEDAKFVKLVELPKHIPWTDGLEEYKYVISHHSPASP